MDPERPPADSKPDEQEQEIDQILADSFPASDAPPWTLGVAEDTGGAVPAINRRISSQSPLDGKPKPRP